MQSPAPRKQKIAGRSDSSKDTKEEEAFDIIENIKAVTEEDKKEAELDDSSDSTIIEREIEDKDPPETDGGSIKKAVEALEVLAIPTSASGVGGTSESSSSSSSSSTSSSSTAGSDKSGVDISSSDSSDSSRSNSNSSDLDASAVNNNNKKYKYKYNKMPSSITKSPVSNGSRATFEEWHSLWEVFGQEQGFDEY
jgi:hypothetical protein